MVVHGDPHPANTLPVREPRQGAASGFVLVDPDGFGDGIEGAVDHYVAMTRATQQLVVLTCP